ncbi:MAG: hypothetical protein KDK97_07715 [Verrucomicrobiales bacterium]|nr:hypothetical protein [Verrucomicrobiales bacterium]MCP5560684.1 hypothetical protein [Verrucomicrobiaceae bacterium]
MNSIPAAAWNRLVDFLARNQILGSTMLRSGDWMHPWQLSPAWEGEQWTTRIEPGFVNGLDATVRLPLRDAPEAARQRLGDQGLGDADPVDCWLTEDPQMVLADWRAIGPDAEPGAASLGNDGTLEVSFESVPDFFTALGVGQPPNLSSQVADLGVVQRLAGELGTIDEARLLRAAELVLYQDRFATSTQWTTGLGFDGTNAQFSVIYKMPPHMRERAYIRSMARWQEAGSIPAQDRLMGDWTDNTFDACHLATVYLVSPPGAVHGSRPDGTWTPYVRHRLFWNLTHAVSILEPALKRENLVLNTGLTAGLLDSIGNQILAAINDQNAAIAEFLGRNTLEGRFWST